MRLLITRGRGKVDRATARRFPCIRADLADCGATIATVQRCRREVVIRSGNFMGAPLEDLVAGGDATTLPHCGPSSGPAPVVSASPKRVHSSGGSPPGRGGIASIHDGGTAHNGSG